MGCEHRKVIVLAGYSKCVSCGELLSADEYDPQEWEITQRLRARHEARRRVAIRNARNRRFRHG